jgi:hypothetical protein
MGFGLYDLVFAALFFSNALAVVHERRFLAKYGWDKPKYESESVKSQIVHLLFTARTYLQLPLIACNIAGIILLITFG